MGVPVVVTVKVPAVPDTKVAESALVMAGASVTFSVKDCVAALPMPLSAVMVIG